MTTKIKVETDANSNGDVHIRGATTLSLSPGQKADIFISESNMFLLFETYPAKVLASNQVRAAQLADDFIAAECAKQDRPDRDPENTGQLMRAGMAQLDALYARRMKQPAFHETPAIYPEGWSGFRDYGSDVANLVVACAFLRREITRLIASGASTDRNKRV